MGGRKSKNSKTAAESSPEQSSDDTLLIIIRDGVPIPEDKPGWTFYKLLTILNQTAEMVRMRMIEIGIEKTLEHATQVQEVLDMMAKKDEHNS